MRSNRGSVHSLVTSILNIGPRSLNITNYNIAAVLRTAELYLDLSANISYLKDVTCVACTGRSTDQIPPKVGPLERSFRTLSRTVSSGAIASKLMKLLR